WTQYSFAVTETTTAPKPGPAPLFRMKLSDQAMRTLLQLQETKSAPVENIHTKVLTVAKATKPQAFLASAAVPGGGVTAERISPRVFTATAANLSAATSVSNAALHNNLMVQYRTLDVKNRLIVAQFVGSAAPTQPATTKSISIGFEYCKTDIKRPWYI